MFIYIIETIKITVITLLNLKHVIDYFTFSSAVNSGWATLMRLHKPKQCTDFTEDVYYWLIVCIPIVTLLTRLIAFRWTIWIWAWLKLCTVCSMLLIINFYLRESLWDCALGGLNLWHTKWKQWSSGGEKTPWKCVQ